MDRSTRAVLGAASLFLVLSGPLAAEEAMTPALKLQDCQIASASGVRRVDAKCGTWSVAEDPANPKGKRIDLKVAVVPARAKAKQKAPDPLFLLAGGPGQGAIESFVPMLDAAFGRVREFRDIVLVDQRGTGDSNRMSCDFDRDWEPEDLDTDVRVAVAWMNDCKTRLPGDVRFYTTSVAIDDLDAVRVALGLKQINLYGGSYGTRVALAYLRKYPDAVRSVIIDGVVPQDMTLGPQISLESQRAAEQMFQRCAKDEACAKAFPKLAEEFDAVIERLRGKPIAVVIRDPISGERLETQMTYDGVAAAVRMLLYSTESVSLLPLIIHAAAAGDYQPLASQATLVRQQMTDLMAIGMHNAVICTEDAPFYADDPATHQRMRETYLGTFAFDMLSQVCGAWPKGIMDAGFKDAVTSDKPVLLLSGEIDPITPPANAEHALKTLSNAQHLVAPNQGHIVAMRGCAPKLIGEFMKSADAKGLDGACLKALHGAPFMVRFTGSEP
jgi:pimeloyl-ACP methyl ester carboxylesterase